MPCDSASLNNLKVKAKAKTPITVVYAVGSGTRYALTINHAGSLDAQALISSCSAS